jgi:hypothetical protein
MMTHRLITHHSQMISWNIGGHEKGQPLNMIPMRVCNEQMDV